MGTRASRVFQETGIWQIACFSRANNDGQNEECRPWQQTSWISWFESCWDMVGHLAPMPE